MSQSENKKSSKETSTNRMIIDSKYDVVRNGYQPEKQEIQQPAPPPKKP
ncbi:hypothetical protein NOM07_16705 [Proteus terrae]|nr:hypothetical protein [Proteus terrae]MCS6716172.1 hypothetical protein [Proteus terrae]MCS6734004.1 hypothetical protein [Proteus terrae]